MKRCIDLDALDAAYKAYYDFGPELQLAEEQAWAEFVCPTLVENERG